MSDEAVQHRSRGPACASRKPQWWVKRNGRWGWVTIGADVCIAWAGLLALMIALGLLVTGPLESRISPTNNQIARWFGDHRTHMLTPLAEIGATGGDTITTIVMAVCVAVAVSWLRRTPRRAVFLSVGLVGQALIGTVALCDQPAV